MAGAIGGLVGGMVSSLVSSVAGSVMSSLISSFGSGNVLGALTNTFMGSLGNALKSVIGSAPIPQFLKDTANGLIDSMLGASQQPTTPEAQDAVSGKYQEMCDKISAGIAQEAGDKADKETNGKGGVNWLVALAGGLAEAQIKFLDKAMDAQETMKEAAGKDDKTSRDSFITAQSEYQANMQMFSMMANMTATSLKTLGEGLTAIARKQ